jgi:hypothetical protein
VGGTKITTEDESPILSDYESDGFLSRRKSLSKRSQAKLGIFKRAKKLTPRKEVNGSDVDEDDVPLVTLVNKASSNVVTVVPREPAQVNGSDADEDDVPLVTLVNKASSNVVTVVAPVVPQLKGDACIGLHIARDFGGAHGVCKGIIVSVDLHRRRVLYDDGDEEDYDDQELQYAIELHEALKNGIPFMTQNILEQGTHPLMNLFVFKI